MLQNKLNRSVSSQKEYPIYSAAENNDYEISIKNPWVLANEHSRRSSKILNSNNSKKEQIQECCSDLATNLNLGSPVHKNKDSESKNMILARVTGKRPNSAGNRAFNQEQKHEQLYPNLLSSTIGISRVGVKMNLASMMFSMPEVESSKAHCDSRASITKSKHYSLNYNINSNSLIIIQKYLRGYIARWKVAKDRELYDFLRKKIKIDEDNTIQIGEPLKLSDLTITPKVDNRTKVKENEKLHAHIK